jgi:hypothetical protein
MPGFPCAGASASGILHWKMMLFEGQNTVQFSAANYTSSFVPIVPYENYIDEAVYFTGDTPVVDSFRTKYDDLWTDETRYADYANVTRPLARRSPTFAKDPELNFPPLESFRNRSVGRYNAETQAIDVIMYRITDRSHTDAMIRAMQRGVPVRLITEPQQYRDRSRHWHSWNVDRLYAAGAVIRHCAHAGMTHQKSVLLRSQRMTIFGSSNWTSPSSSSQEEHNYFTIKPYFYSWFSEQFEREWTNATGHLETEPFTPPPPGRPTTVAPAHGSALDGTDTVTLVWNGGIWAHLFDIYFGTTPDPPLLAADQALGLSVTTSDNKAVRGHGARPGHEVLLEDRRQDDGGHAQRGTRVQLHGGGRAPPPPPPGDDIVLYAAEAPLVRGNWVAQSDPAAAAGTKLTNPDAALPKLTPAAANSADYFELTFEAEAGRPYHLWVRGRADRNYYGNDSVHVQFSGSVTRGGSRILRIGTSSSAEVCIEDGTGAGLAGWGWQDNGWGTLGDHVYFASAGRIQNREDGLVIDQIVLSPGTYANAAPGALKDDTTMILPESSGS